MSHKIQLIDLVNKSDFNTISSYLPYLTCEICLNAVLDPKYCLICRKSFCNQCLCIHNPKVSRHIEELTDRLTIKCKFDCENERFPLKFIYGHIEKCKFKDKFLPKLEYSTISFGSNNKSSNKQEKEFKPTELDITSQLYDKKLFDSIENKESNSGIQCFNCNNTFLTKIEYFKHVIDCLSLQENKNEAIENQQKVFNEEFELIRSKMSIGLKEKLINMRNIYYQEFNWLIEDIADKEKECKDKENKIDKYNETKEDGLFIKDDSIAALQEIECELKKEKEKLIEVYENKTKQLLQSSNDSVIKSNQSTVNAYLNKSTESSWVSEMITSLLLGIEGSCFKCGSDSSDKHTCLSCKQKYCKGKCVFKCLEANCTNYSCPKCTIECSLCHKKIYCDKCKKKCFYEKCPNVFCIPCYSKNEHQARSITTNCRFFNCAKEKVNSCLMTTLFCEKCNKRLCNDCLVQDKNHYDCIKIFN